MKKLIQGHWQMERQNITFYLNLTIISAILSLVLIDGILQGQAQMIGLFVSLTVVAVALIGNFALNHREIMELNAPGARLYQSLAHAFSPARRQDTPQQ